MLNSNYNLITKIFSYCKYYEKQWQMYINTTWLKIIVLNKDWEEQEVQDSDKCTSFLLGTIFGKLLVILLLFAALCLYVLFTMVFTSSCAVIEDLGDLEVGRV